MYWHTYLSIALLAFSATCFVLAWVKEGKIKVDYFMHRLPHGQFIILEITIFKVAFQLSITRAAWGLFDFGRSTTFDYRWVSLLNLILKWKVTK